MKYTKAERLEIGRRIYEGELNKFQAAEEYDIGYTTARNYMRSYRYANGLPAKSRGEYVHKQREHAKPVIQDPDLEELIRELVRSKIREARLKKGYEVKGDGAEKVFIPLGSKNTK